MSILRIKNACFSASKKALLDVKLGLNFTFTLRRVTPK